MPVFLGTARADDAIFFIGTFTGIVFAGGVSANKKNDETGLDAR